MANPLEGVAQLTRQLNDMGAAVAGKELKGTAKSAMKIAYDKIVATAPVGSVPHKTYKGRLVAPGFYKRSLRLIARINKRLGSVEAIVGAAREAFYGVLFVELGTSKMAAQPHIRPAMESSQESMLQQIASQLRNRLERIAKKK